MAKRKAGSSRVGRRKRRRTNRRGVTTGKKGVSGLNNIAVPRFSVLPQKRRAVHRYHEKNLALNPGLAGILAEYVFVANGMYDPNLTGSGHQPIGFDQMNLFYNQHHVIGSRIVVTIISQETTYPGIVGIYANSTAALTSSSIDTIIEQGNGVFSTVLTKDLPQSSSTLQFSFSTAKFSGSSKVLSDDNLAGSSSANPTTSFYYHIVAAPIPNVDMTSCYLDVLIEYVSIWSDPKEVTGS